MSGPSAAISLDWEKIAAVDPEKCIEFKTCIDASPFEAILADYLAD